MQRISKNHEMPSHDNTYFLGIDTTAHTATFLLFHLASNPEKQVQQAYVASCRLVISHYCDEKDNWTFNKIIYNTE